MTSTNELRIVAGASFDRIWRELIAPRLTVAQRNSRPLRSTIRDAYVRGWFERDRWDGTVRADTRILPTRRADDASRVYAHAVPGLPTVVPVPGTGVPTGDTDLYRTEQLTLYSEHNPVGRGEGGTGGFAPLVVPDTLVEFDTILQRIPVYAPTQRFYERIVSTFVGVAGLDLAYEAEGIVRYCTTDPRGRKRTDIPRTVENWLSNTVERLRKVRPINGNGRPQSGYNAGRPYGMGGATQDGRAGAERYMRRGYDDDA